MPRFGSYYNTGEPEEQGTYYTSTSSVTGERIEDTQFVTGTTTTIRVSARPMITYVRPPSPVPIWHDHTPRAVVGFPTMIVIQGKNFDKQNLTVYVSAGVGVYTNRLSAVTAFDLFGGQSTSVCNSSLATLYPPFSGFRVTDFTVHTPYAMTFPLSATQAAGFADIIIANNAGYCALSVDLTGRIVRIES